MKNWCLTGIIESWFRRILREELDRFFKEKIMVTIDEVQAKVDSLQTGLADVVVEIQAVNDSLDRIAALVAGLEANNVDQAKIDSLSASVDQAKATLASVAAIAAEANTKDDEIK